VFVCAMAQWHNGQSKSEWLTSWASPWRTRSESL